MRPSGRSASGMEGVMGLSDQNAVRLMAMLDRCRDSLIARWRHRVLRDPAIPKAKTLSTSVLDNHFPDMILQISHYLHSGRTMAGAQAGRVIGTSLIARHHAANRFEHGY